MHKLTVLLAVALVVCNQQPAAPLVAADLEITPAMPGKSMRAAYLALTNNTDDAIRISRVTSDAFAIVELHETTVDDGVARMRPLDALVIPAGATVRLQRGGKHLMLMRPSGTAASITLRFFDGDQPVLTVSAPLATESG